MAKKKKVKSGGDRPDYSKLKQMAYELIVVQGKSQKGASALVGISEKQMSAWAKDGDWRELRKSRQSAASTARENIEQLINLLSEKRLNLELHINAAIDKGDKDTEIQLRKQANQISNDMAYQNKSLRELNKEKGATLGMYVDIFTDIFHSLRAFDPDLFDKTIPFQNVHLRAKANNG